ncbi:helicase HerA domain-containing protein [Hyphomicrobium sp. DY-1]|uniref:helicase HerA domain-containing protein n=1 Tax=Hyphomicrobium sp. DY-1 TaxID=3075650 RepID=UPI0039C4D1DE
MTLFPIPDEALDDRLAIVGTSGSGKTYAMTTAVERLLDRKSKVVMIDPLGVSWGIRLKANGKDAAFPVVIFGGDHADIDITEQSGKLIGEAIAGAAESAVIDLSNLGTKSAERRFMLGFLEAMYRNSTGEPFHLIFDEADLWAPQRSMEPQLQGLMENIVRRGRVKGFIPWLITQRPAVISKDVLSQADGLVAMKLTAKQDRDALGAWIEGQADKAEQKEFNAKLPTMQRGHGILWIPGRGILQSVKFPTKTTFDSSSTPKRGEKRQSASLKPIDIGSLKAAIAAIEAEKTKPKQVARTTSTAATTIVQPEPAALRAAEDRGRAAGFDEGRRVGFAEGEKAALKKAQSALGAIQADEPTLAALPARAAQPLVVGKEIVLPPQKMKPAIKMAYGVGTQMPKAERLVLTALAQYPSGRTKVQIAILTGYASSGGGFNNALSALRTKGWLTGHGQLSITDAGIEALGEYEPLPSGEALLQHWLNQLAKAERAALLVLAQAWPRALTKEEVADQAGYEAKGGGFNNALSRLRTLELISGRGELRASDDLFDEAA